MAGVLKASDTSPTTTKPKLLNFSAPVDPTGFAGLYILDSSLPNDKVLLNFANADLPLTKIGTPTSASGGGMQIDGANGFDTGIAETSAMTWFAVVKPRLTGQAVIMKTMTGGSVVTDAATLAIVESGGDSNFRMLAKNGSNAAVNAAAPAYTQDAADWNIAMGCFDTTELRAGRSYDGNYAETTAGFSGRTVASGTIRIGGFGTITTYTNAVEILAAGIVTSKLSSGDRSARVVEFRQWAAASGIETL